MAARKKAPSARPADRPPPATAAGLSEDHLAAVLDAALDAVITMDAAGHISGWHGQAAAMFGWSAEEALGRSLADTIVPARFREAHVRGLAAFLATGEGPILGRRVELTGQHRSGREFPVELAVAPYRRGDTWSFTAFVRDISEARRANQFLRQVIDADPNLIFVRDWEGRLTLVNRAMAERYGATTDGLIGRRDADFNPDAEQVAIFLRQDREVMTSGQPMFIAEEPVSDVLTGERRWLQTIKVPLMAPDPASRQVLCVSTDITDRKRADAIREAGYLISEAVDSTLELPELFAAIHGVVRGLMPADNLYLAVVDPLTGLLTFPYFADQHDPAPEPRPMGRGLTELVLRTGASMLATPEVFDELVASGDVSLVGAPSVDWVGVPLKSQGRTFGALVVQTYMPGVRFGETERHLLEMVSGHVALAIERKQGREELRQREERFRALLEHSADAVCTYNAEGRIEFASVGVTKLLGYPVESVMGRGAFEFIHPEDAPSIRRQIRDLLGRSGGDVVTMRARIRHLDGTWRLMEGTFSNLLATPGVGAIVNNFRDVTERHRLEDQVRQAQKMEAVGRLAGGVAHDFNNLLTVVLSATDFLLPDFLEEDPRRVDLVEIRQAAERAATLTRQLLAYSRKQVLQPTVLDLNQVVGNVERLLRRLIGEDIELRAELAGDLGAVRADAGQIEQVIANLAVNARDAMPRGGRLTIATSNVEPDAAPAPDHLDRPAGRCVLLTVSDTGVGMDAETRAHCFEPFYTTKGAGEGTGLGLATVFGIVQQSGGAIWVDSEPGRGTTLSILLPCVAVEPAPRRPEVAPSGEAPRGTETILLVEDEPAVRDLTRRALEGRGYAVLAADGGAAALDVLERHATPIHLLVTDVVMPGMDGCALAEEVVRRRPATRVLYVSGYSDAVIRQRSAGVMAFALLPKPYSIAGLAEKVREVLDTPAG